MKIQHIINRFSACGRIVVCGVLLTAATSSFADDGKILKGRIVNADGEPIVGAVVNVAENLRIAVTDENGFFTLKKVKDDDEVNVTCLGYKKATAKPDFENFTLTMEEVNEYLEDVPMPFTRKEKILTTEATSTVTGEELQKHPVTVLQDAFTSTLNGVTTYQSSSEPGWAETTMYIRGLRTMNSSARSPLIIVDNVERDLSFLDAYPIESITILKDAAATAIYGMRGANGVVMVTTKRGAAGKTNIDFTQEVGWLTLTNTMETQNSYNMVKTRNQVRYLSGLEPLYSDEQVEKYRKVCAGEELEGTDKYRYFNTNWFDQLYRSSAPILRTNLQISGGGKKARYYVSFSWLRHEGMWNTEGTEWNSDFSTQHVLNRWNLRSNIDIDVTKNLNVSLDLGGRIDNIKQPTTGVFSLVTFGAVEAEPTRPVYNPDGSLYASSVANNPINYLAASGQEKNRRRNLYSTLNLKYDLSDLVKGLGLFATVSFDAYETFESTQTNAINTYNYDLFGDWTDVSDITYTRYTTASALSNPSANQRNYYYNLNTYGGVSYKNRLGKHGLDAKLFMRFYRNEFAGSDNTSRQQQSSRRYMSWNGMFTYDYDRRYVASFNLSRMGNDNFSEDNRWDTFFGVSGAWNISEEKFFKNDITDLLKLRLSYGRTGQAETGTNRYPYQSTYSSGTGYAYGYNASYVTGYYESLAGSENNKWEISKMINAGLDWDFWGKKFYGSFDIFKEWRSDILVSRSTIPSMVGVSVAQDSYGKVESWGHEIKLGHANHIGDFGYHFETQFSFSRNKITEMDETEPSVEWQRKTGRRIYGNEEVASIYEWENRTAIGGWNIYQFQQWATDENLIATSQQDAIDHPEKYPYNTFGTQTLGTAVFVDVDGDRQITSNDMVPATFNMIPDIVWNFNLGFSWKGFDARAVFTAYLNRNVFLSPAISYSGWSNMGTHEVTKAWGYYTDDPTDPRNINATYPRPLYGGFDAIDSNRDTGTYKNSIWIVNGNYLALNNVEIGYSLPQKWISKLWLTKCRVYFSGYNLTTWSSLPDGVDPEKPMSYCWWYPKTRSFTFGVNIGF